MKPSEAKALTLEVWSYLAEHPKLYTKCQLPPDLYDQIKGLKGGCPLCELFSKGYHNCDSRCPLIIRGKTYGCGFRSAYYKWTCSYCSEIEKRKTAAQSIVRRVDLWKPASNSDGT